jgi:hypothetical protein
MEMKRIRHVGLRAMKLAGRVQGLSSRARAVLGEIGNFANAKGFAYPSEGTLADATDLAVSTVRLGVRELEQEKIITVDRTGWRRSNCYQINIERLAEMGLIWGPAGPANVDEVDL